IMPTILALTGIQGPTNMQGRSLVGLLNGSATATWQERPAITQAMVGDPDGGPPGGGGERKPEKPHFGIVDHGWTLVRKEVDPAADEELYEPPVDSLNLTNVIKSDGSTSHVKALAQTLEAWKIRARAAQLPSDETMTQQLSSEELRRLRALGYVGGGTTPKPDTNSATGRTATNATAPTNIAPNPVTKTNAPGADPHPKEDDR